MIELLILGVLGFAVGGFGTLVGAGGGFILVPVLLFLYPELPPETITAMSLFVVMGNASSGSIAYAVHKRIDYRSGLLFAVATLPGAVAGAYVITFIPRETFNIIFASVLGVLGSYLLLRRSIVHQRDPVTGRGVVTREIVDRAGERFVYSYRLPDGMAISSAVGFVSSLLGIGGGIVHVPVMAVVLRFPVHIATATSHFVLALMAFEAVATHFANGTLGWDETLARSAAIMAGAVVGAQLGAHASHRVGGPTIIRALGGALVLVAIRLAITR